MSVRQQSRRRRTGEEGGVWGWGRGKGLGKGRRGEEGEEEGENATPTLRSRACLQDAVARAIQPLSTRIGFAGAAEAIYFGVIRGQQYPTRTCMFDDVRPCRPGCDLQNDESGDVRWGTPTPSPALSLLLLLPFLGTLG